MKIELMGDGCGKWCQLEKHLKEALEKTGVESELHKGSDPERIAHYGLLTLPGLAINGKLVARGEVLAVDTIVKLLSEA